MARLVRHLDAGQEVEAVSAPSVQLDPSPRRIGTVVVGDGKKVEVRLLLHVAEELSHVLVPVPPGVMAAMRMEIGLAHESILWHGHCSPSPRPVERNVTRPRGPLVSG